MSVVGVQCCVAGRCAVILVRMEVMRSSEWVSKGSRLARRVPGKRVGSWARNVLFGVRLGMKGEELLDRECDGRR